MRAGEACKQLPRAGGGEGLVYGVLVQAGDAPRRRCVYAAALIRVEKRLHVLFKLTPLEHERRVLCGRVRIREAYEGLPRADIRVHGGIDIVRRTGPAQHLHLAVDVQRAGAESLPLIADSGRVAGKRGLVGHGHGRCAVGKTEHRAGKLASVGQRDRERRARREVARVDVNGHAPVKG